MTFGVLLANIGGQMGLFVGISVISIIEIFSELMIFRLLPRFWGDRRLYGVGSTDNLNQWQFFSSIHQYIHTLK